MRKLALASAPVTPKMMQLCRFAPTAITPINKVQAELNATSVNNSAPPWSQRQSFSKSASKVKCCWVILLQKATLFIRLGAMFFAVLDISKLLHNASALNRQSFTSNILKRVAGILINRTERKGTTNKAMRAAYAGRRHPSATKLIGITASLSPSTMRLSEEDDASNSGIIFGSLRMMPTSSFNNIFRASHTLAVRNMVTEARNTGMNECNPGRSTSSQACNIQSGGIAEATT
mmetsp:Transcript_48361/g.96147  ORF Transcript_48361/g.96147 Transcript_48361/m.96147 type:complete len:233 (+) Transcript_48361:692-1390(+)